MKNERINIFLNTFEGLGLPRTLCLNVSASSSVSELLSVLNSQLPDQAVANLYITTIGNRRLLPSNSVVADIIDSPSCLSHSLIDFLQLRLHAPLVGGKGGFGSQLRAAGGRMSSRKKRQNAELATGSARNLDGRRLRTIKEAKNLATYLATKPEMDRKQKDEKRKRWEQVIELAEQREIDMRAGKGVDGRRKGLSDEWIEEKEEVADNVKNAVQIAMAANTEASGLESSNSDHSPAGSDADNSEDEDLMELDESDMAKLTREAEAGDADALWVLKNKLKIPATMLPKKRSQRRFVGFDDDDLSSNDSDNENEKEEEEEDTVDKGKTVVHDV